ncbi:MAG: hypothetical protein HYY35_01480 [Deltaproteobacteria bacterium]|nr:hypothetical protein [Deltaproteobacteria bacterium]
MESAFHLPGPAPSRTRTVAFAGVPLSVAELSGEDMRALLAALRARPDRASPAARARAVAAAARRFLDRGDPLRRRALAALPALTGFSQAMIEQALPRAFGPLRERDLLGVATRRSSPAVDLVGIVSAGNLPGVALAKAALALAAGAACLVKTASGEPLLAVLFAEALSEVDPSLATSLAVLWWEGGRGACEAEFLRGADSIIAYGSDAAVGALRALAGRKVVGHAHRLSVAVVRLDVPRAAPPPAEAAALDVALYDQLGCLSPQCLYTVGGSLAQRAAFLEQLARALGELDRRLPSGARDASQAVAVRRLRDEYEWRALGGEPVSLRGGAGWTVIDDPTAGFRPSPLHRTVIVRRLDALEQLAAALGEWLPRVESVGMDPWPDPEAAAWIARRGVPRVAPLGSMQSPGLDWRQGGRDPMAGIIQGEIA